MQESFLQVLHMYLHNLLVDFLTEWVKLSFTNLYSFVFMSHVGKELFIFPRPVPGSTMGGSAHHATPP